MLALFYCMSRHQRNIDRMPLLALLLATGAVAQTPVLQDVESIRSSAAAFVRGRFQSSDSAVLHADAGALDPRLRLPACLQPPKAFSPSGELRATSRLTIGVRCETPAWTVYVPVNVETEIAVFVTTRALPHSAAVTLQDVESQRRRVSGVAAGYIVSADQLAGRHLRSAAAPGTALAVDMFSPDVLIKRGQRVTLVATAGSLEVRAQGEAIGDAQADGRVRVLNLASRRIVEGRVEGRDSVRIGL
jgi:flagellar basal body P-ring formation protein FlgA